MKRTKNMVYTPSDEARELFLYAINSSKKTYFYIMRNLVPSFKKKYAKGIYDSDKAVNAYYRAATMASDEYKRDFGYGFSVTDRFTVAVDLEEDFREFVEE